MLVAIPAGPLQREDLQRDRYTVLEGRLSHRERRADGGAGLVIMRLSWNQRGPGSDWLTAWEMFKAGITQPKAAGALTPSASAHRAQQTESREEQPAGRG